MAGRPQQALFVLDLHQRGDALANAIRGDAYLRAGSFERAIEYYQLSARQSPHDPWVYLSLGNALLAVGDTPGAIAAWQQALALQSDFAPAHSALCQINRCP
jgi:predicted Zn-dependent protease